MNTKASDIRQWAKSAIDSLCSHPDYRSNRSLYIELADYSGLSVSLIQQFHNGSRANPSVKTLDRLVAAIRRVYEHAAAA